MRVLHIVNDIDPRLGGSVQAARQMATSMQSCGVEIEVLTLVEPQKDWAEDWPVKVHALGGTLSRYGYTRRLAPWLRLNHLRYSALIIHGVWRYPSWGVQRVLRRFKTPYFVFTHGMLDPWFRSAYPLKHLKKKLFWLMWEHRVLRDALGVCFTSEEERVLASRSFQPYLCREYVVGLGTMAPPPGALLQRKAFLAAFPTLAQKRILLFLGRIHRKKGCDLLVQSFCRLAPSDPALQLVIAGPDEEGLRGHLEGLALAQGMADRITWTGHLEGDLKWGAFRAAEAFVLPSHSENYGIALVEAMACGVPVLISDKVNIWREVADDMAGLVASDDLNGTIELLHRWLALTSEQRERMRIGAFNCYQHRFELQGFAERFVEFLKQEVGLGTPVGV